MIKSFKDISIIKASGIKRFIMLDLHDDEYFLTAIERKEPIWNITKSSILNKCRIIGHRNEFINVLPIHDALKEFIDDNKLQGSYIILGINKYRITTVVIPEDVDDIGIWFEENNKKFIPEGRTSNEFELQYEQYYKDDKYIYCFVIIIRKDYLGDSLTSIKPFDLNVINISPFILSIPQETAKDDNLNLIITSKTIHYFFKPVNGSIESGEIFISNSQEVDYYKDELTENLERLKTNLSNIFGSERITNSNIFISSTKKAESFIHSLVKENFNSKNINPYLPENSITINSSLLSLNSLINGSGKEINLLDIEKRTNIQFDLEKKVTLKYVASFGVILLLLLLILNSANIYLENSIENRKDEFMQSNLKIKRINELKIENKRILNNLSSLLKLRAKNDRYSSMLDELSTIVNRNIRLINVDLLETEENQIQIKILGTCDKQNDVAQVLGEMEASVFFSNSSLEYTRANTKAGSKNKLKKFHFKITSNYEDNPK